MFENMRDNSMGASSSRYLPFRREHFTDKQIYFPFDANFNRLDEGGMRSQYIGQNASELMHSIDSIGHEVDSVGAIYAHDIRTQPYFGIAARTEEAPDGSIRNTVPRTVQMSTPLDIDSIYQSRGPGMVKSYINQALAKAKRQKQEYLYRSLTIEEQAKLMRRHDIELQRKFTLSFACIIFFFIGAPLGAIIKKGGLGTPLVISVLLFIVYFLIDNIGYKMARDGKVDVWEGIWLSSLALLPLGIFFTYKAVGDSAVFNVDAYKNFFRQIAGRTIPRDLTLKEVRMVDVEKDRAIEQLLGFLDVTDAEINRLGHTGKIKKLFAPGLPVDMRLQLNQLVDYLSNSTDIYTINLLNQYPFKPTVRNLTSIRATTLSLLDRMGYKQQETSNETQESSES